MSNARKLAANLPIEGSLSERNMVINGGFQIFQRATAATTVITGKYQTADRWRLFENTDGAYTTERSTDTPSGTGFSLKAAVTTADTSIAAAQYASIEHYVEAQNCQHLAYGTSAAKTITLSFFVKSSKTGTYTIALYKSDNTGYIYTREYTINSANTWEKKTINITPTAGSTSFITSSGGAIVNDNGIGLALGFNLAWGSNFNSGTSDVWSATTSKYTTTNAVNWMDSTSNNFYLAEVKLEVGSQSTPFEHEPVGVTLSKCQRYFFQETTTGADSSGRIGVASGAATVVFDHALPVQMRANPSVSLTSTNLRIGDMVAAGFTTTSGTVSLSGYTGSTTVVYVLGGFSGLTSYRSYLHEPDASHPGTVKFSAEL